MLFTTLRPIVLMPIAALLLVAAPQPLYAASLSYSGSFNQLFGEQLPFLQFSLGSTFTGSFEVSDPIAIGSLGNGTTIDLGASTFTYLGNTLTSDSGLMVQQPINGAEHTSWNAFNIAGTVGGHAVNQIIFSAIGPDLFGSPSSPPNFTLADLSSVLITLQIRTFQGNIATLRGGLNQMQFADAIGTIPIPAALPLLASGLIGLALVSARRRTRTENQRLSHGITP